jgi:predicted ester cyclase
MSADENKAWMQRYFTAMENEGKTAEVIGRFVEDDDLTQHILMFEAAFPDYDIIPEDVIAEDDKVAIRGTFRGVHRGELMGVAPTGRTVELPLQLMYQIRNEKIVKFWMSADTLLLMQQLGAVPVPAASA